MAPQLPQPQPPPPPPPKPPVQREDSGATAKKSSALNMPISLQPAYSKRRTPSRSERFFRKFKSTFRSLPIVVPPCNMPTVPRTRPGDLQIHGGKRITGTLFGHRKSRVNLAFQETPNTLPFLLLELAIPTGKLLQDMGTGMNRIAMECEKQPRNDKVELVDEPCWTMFCNGKKMGYGVKREPTDEDLSVMQLLHAVSMAVGVLPEEMSDPHDGKFSYMRAHFERVVGSKDSETYYMTMPHGNNGLELTVFFVRV
ncbi:protein MIZU-KUSSEI 1 [Arachis duranensis]|uniref:Protein MIZU-KUSSEI 1 n=1 Tax=Arachis duranensis TaxID=130453 RepID=A0A6P4BFS7_ARADU|nr:protein MIZU-KUSSEI 1 [Arachis duranensis]